MMRSKKSFFDWTVFKKTFLRFWPVWAAYSVIWLVALPLNGLMRLQMDANAYPGVTDGYIKAFARDFVPGVCSASLFFAACFGVLAAMAVCSHLYNAKSANFFGSLPIRREGMFLTHYLAGLSFLIVPNAAIFLLTLLVEAVGGAVFLSELLFWMGVTCGECLFFYSMAVFCGMFTGHILALPAFYAIFNALAYVLYFLMQWVFNSFYYGFHGFESGVAGFVAWLTPLLRLARGVYGSYFEWSGSVFTGMNLVGVYAAAGVALAVGAFFLYRFRRLESAGDVVSVKCMRPVFKYSVAVCSGLCFGMLTAQIVNMHEPGMMVSMLVWAVIGCFVAQMLLDKSFKVFHKWKGAAAVAGAFLLMYVVVGFDLTGYETRVPTADQVDYVEFSGANTAHLGDGADYLTVVREDPEFIELAILLHQTAVDQRDGSRPGGELKNSSLSFVYHLKNGSTLTRWYTIWVAPQEADQEGSGAWAIQQIYNNRDLYWEAYGFDEADRRMDEEGYRLQEVTYEDRNYSGTADPNRYYYGKDAEALYEAVKEDFKANRIGVRKVDGSNGTLEERGRHVLNFQFVGTKGEGEERGERYEVHWSMNMAVQDTASSTLAVLERLDQEGAGDYQAPDNEGNWAMLEDGTLVRYPTVSAMPEEPVPTAVSVPVPTDEPAQ